MEQDNGFSKEELEGLISRLKSHSRTKLQELHAEKQKKQISELQKVRLELAKKNCPHLVPQILQEIETGVVAPVVALKLQEPKKQPTAQEIVATVCAGFCKKFGAAKFSDLPKFQQETFKAMSMLHLGYTPANAGELSQNKAVYLCGKSQIGKTTVFEYLKASGYFTYRMITSYQLAKLAASDFDGTLQSYSRGKFLLIDEVGMETPVNNFGTKHDVVAEIIHERYRQGLFTHFTSNMMVDDLPYDNHIKMRIKQGCNIITAIAAEPFMKK